MKQAVVFGGAGFIGSNLSKFLLDQDYRVVVYDSLARRGSELNIAWLEDRYGPERLAFIHDDIRNSSSVHAAVRRADAVYHLAAQVAVTRVLDPGK